jgi:dipeptidyl aminopeptidase/acylaminoacyl peptidase
MHKAYRLTSLASCILAAVTMTASADDVTSFDAGLENKSGLTFSPDGTVAFWVEWNGKWGSSGDQRVIFTARRGNQGWSEPEPAPFSSNHSDDDPFVSPDGHWLYFISDRPIDNGDRASDTNIWRYGLGPDERLEQLSINSTAAEYSPVITSSGSLYFASAREGGSGQGDLYRSQRLQDGFAEPQLLASSLNSATGEWNLWVSGDESEIIFEASSRPGNVSVSGDLYYSWTTPSGWVPAVPIVSLNTKGSDLMPRLHPDGKTLYYTTAEHGQHAQIVSANWPSLRKQLRTSAPSRP